MPPLDAGGATLGATQHCGIRPAFVSNRSRRPLASRPRAARAAQSRPESRPVTLPRCLLRHLDDRTSYYDRLARAVLGRCVAHVMPLHHNLINALFLRDVI